MYLSGMIWGAKMKISPISVRLTAAEKIWLKEIACEKGLSMSDAIRELIRDNSSSQEMLTLLKRVENQVTSYILASDPSSALDNLSEDLNGIRVELINAQKTYLNTVFNRLCLAELMRHVDKLDNINSQFDEFKKTRGITE
jgi:hypothetical protein